MGNLKRKLKLKQSQAMIEPRKKFQLKNLKTKLWPSHSRHIESFTRRKKNQKHQILKLLRQENRKRRLLKMTILHIMVVPVSRIFLKFDDRHENQPNKLRKNKEHSGNNI